MIFILHAYTVFFEKDCVRNMHLALFTTFVYVFS